MDWIPLFGSQRTRVIEQIFRVRPPACGGAGGEEDESVLSVLTLLADHRERLLAYRRA